MEFLGVIPARGGSKGIPHKNLVEIAGRPLISHTCAAALKSERLDDVVVSTDSDEIAKAAEACGIAAPFRRPRGLAADKTPMLPVLQHAVEWMREDRGRWADAVVVLQPTSPLRTARHIDEAIEHFEQVEPDTLVSVIEVPHNFHPVSLMVEEDGRLRPYGEGDDLILRRQDKPLAYARNGPAILIVSVETLVEEDTLYGPRIAKYEMSRWESVDIDEPGDLAIAELLLEARRR